MTSTDFVRRRVEQYYWGQDLNCAATALLVLAEKHDIELSPQVIAAATGLHGAGEYGAQCGLVEGGLMFLGIVGRARAIPEERIVNACRRFAFEFEKRFTSLLCRELRPDGFHLDQPPHLCEQITCRAIEFTLSFVGAFVRGNTDPA